MTPVLRADRLLLRELTVSDADNLLGIFSDSEAMRFYPGTKNRDETLAWIQWNLASYAEHGFGLWAAQLKDTGEFVGQCGLIRQPDVDGQAETEIGYLFLRTHWNGGLATEAAIACRDYGFETLKLEHLVSLIDPKNLPSRRVAEKVGMHVEKEVEIERWNKRVCVYGMKADEL